MVNAARCVTGPESQPGCTLSCIARSLHTTGIPRGGPLGSVVTKSAPSLRAGERADLLHLAPQPRRSEQGTGPLPGGRRYS